MHLPVPPEPCLLSPDSTPGAGGLSHCLEIAEALGGRRCRL